MPGAARHRARELVPVLGRGGPAPSWPRRIGPAEGMYHSMRALRSPCVGAIGKLKSGPAGSPPAASEGTWNPADGSNAIRTTQANPRRRSRIFGRTICVPTVVRKRGRCTICDGPGLRRDRRGLDLRRSLVGIVTFLLSYGIALASHRIFERIQSLVLLRPSCGALADLRMCWLALTGGLEGELARHCGATPRASCAARRS